MQITVLVLLVLALNACQPDSAPRKEPEKPNGPSGYVDLCQREPDYWLCKR